MRTIVSLLVALLTIVSAGTADVLAQADQVPVFRSGIEVMEVDVNVVDGNAQHDVTWVHSYVSPDHKTTYCVYDGPSPEAIRNAAETNGLPVTKITEVRVLDPYFYH